LNCYKKQHSIERRIHLKVRLSIPRLGSASGVQDFQFPEIDFSNLLILDVMGSRGWELSALSENSRATKRNTIKFYFKRPIEEQEKIDSRGVLKEGH